MNLDLPLKKFWRKRGTNRCPKCRDEGSQSFIGYSVGCCKSKKRRWVEDITHKECSSLSRNRNWRACILEWHIGECREIGRVPWARIGWRIFPKHDLGFSTDYCITNSRTWYTEGGTFSTCGLNRFRESFIILGRRNGRVGHGPHK